MSTKLFTTQSGSLYELDSAQRRVRLLKGAPRSRHLELGVWAQYDAVTELRPGLGLFIVWPESMSTGKDHVACTTTSRVIEVVEKGLVQ